jgi:hypothetical protein
MSDEVMSGTKLSDVVSDSDELVIALFGFSQIFNRWNTLIGDVAIVLLLIFNGQVEAFIPAGVFR